MGLKPRIFLFWPKRSTHRVNPCILEATNLTLRCMVHKHGLLLCLHSPQRLLECWRFRILAMGRSQSGSRHRHHRTKWMTGSIPLTQTESMKRQKYYTDMWADATKWVIRQNRNTECLPCVWVMDSIYYEQTFLSSNETGLIWILVFHSTWAW